MFSFPLAFILLAVPKFMFLKLHIFNHCFELSESFCSFRYLGKFSKMKLSEKFQKNKNQFFCRKSDPEAPGADQGGHPWSRRRAGAAWPLAAPIGRLAPQATFPGTSSSTLSLSFQKHEFFSWNLRYCCSPPETSISLYSPLFELKF